MALWWRAPAIWAKSFAWAPELNRAAITRAPPSAADRGSVKVRWQAHDDNDDQLSYSLFYRGDEENNWKPLSHDKITEKTFSFDSSLLPDGGYLIRVVATDAPSHSPEEALSGNKQSARFEIDSTPPRIEDLHAAAEGGQGLHVTFRAVPCTSYFVLP